MAVILGSFFFVKKLAQFQSNEWDTIKTFNAGERGT